MHTEQKYYDNSIVPSIPVTVSFHKKSDSDNSSEAECSVRKFKSWFLCKLMCHLWQNWRNSRQFPVSKWREKLHFLSPFALSNWMTNFWDRIAVSSYKSKGLELCSVRIHRRCRYEYTIHNFTTSFCFLPCVLPVDCTSF